MLFAIFYKSHSSILFLLNYLFSVWEVIKNFQLSISSKFALSWNKLYVCFEVNFLKYCDRICGFAGFSIFTEKLFIYFSIYFIFFFSISDFQLLSFIYMSNSKLAAYSVFVIRRTKAVISLSNTTFWYTSHNDLRYLQWRSINTVLWFCTMFQIQPAWQHLLYVH